jgi:ubiquinone/menaquinone biosynthesis C-methylase UbiE
MADIETASPKQSFPSSETSAERWERAYQRFETPAEERAKFRRRLRFLGCSTWPAESRVVELFCGRGNGLHALESLGFRSLEGVDISPRLLEQYTGSAKTYAADCRALPLADQSRDILIVQGGLHHLLTIPEDLRATLGEAKRVLRPGGRFVVVEPWSTIFLRFVHGVARVRAIRRLSSKVDALATMIELEQPTYRNWLRNGPIIVRELKRLFEVETLRIAWGKLSFVGRT